MLLQDIILHVAWIICWFIASVDWAVAFHRLDQVLNDYMDNLIKSDCAESNKTLDVFPLEKDRESVIYVQAQIAVVMDFTYFW